MMKMTDYTRCESAKDVPSEPHYAIIEFKKVNEPDGWGGFTLGTKITYFAFKNKELWEQAISDMEESNFGVKPDYVALYVSKAIVKTVVRVEIDKNIS